MANYISSGVWKSPLQKKALQQLQQMKDTESTNWVGALAKTLAGLNSAYYDNQAKAEETAGREAYGRLLDQNTAYGDGFTRQSDIDAVMKVNPDLAQQLMMPDNKKVENGVIYENTAGVGKTPNWVATGYDAQTQRQQQLTDRDAKWDHEKDVELAKQKQWIEQQNYQDNQARQREKDLYGWKQQQEQNRISGLFGAAPTPAAPSLFSQPGQQAPQKSALVPAAPQPAQMAPTAPQAAPAMPQQHMPAQNAPQAQTAAQRGDIGQIQFPNLTPEDRTYIGQVIAQNEANGKYRLQLPPKPLPRNFPQTEQGAAQYHAAVAQYPQVVKKAQEAVAQAKYNDALELANGRVGYNEKLAIKQGEADISAKSEYHKKDAAYFDDIRQQGNDALETKFKIKTAQEVLSKIDPTLNAVSRPMLDNLLAIIGIDTKGWDDKQVLASLSSEFLLSKTKMLSGALSDRDMAELAKSIPNVSQSPAAFKRVLELMDKAANRNIMRSKTASGLRKQFGTIENFDEVWGEQMKAEFEREEQSYQKTQQAHQQAKNLTPAQKWELENMKRARAQGKQYDTTPEMKRIDMLMNMSEQELEEMIRREEAKRRGGQ